MYKVIETIVIITLMSITILLKQMYFKMNTLLEKEKLQNCEFAHRGFVK